jgi:hypothetical protein
MVVKEIVYEPEHRESGQLDLHLPDDAADCPTVIVVHAVRPF